MTKVDEIQNYVDARYICPHEAAWRIFNFIQLNFRNEWVPFVKSVTNLADDDYKRLQYKTMHEAVIKDVERAFGVLKKKWAILASPAQAYIKEKLTNIMYTCIILHNMIIKDCKEAISPKWYPEEEHQPDDLLRSDEQRYRVIRSEFGVRSDLEYETD
uniref:Protein ALP1-like n=1 Tax=Tanacetum cinerariifolium TaxID=118510 RepID=A0A6L2NP08_TANCI|nr:protein ALP1-like [Tanacetum cinerariifolium]